MHGVPRFSATRRSTTAVALPDRRPVAHQLLHLELHRDRVDAVMRRQPPRELGVRLHEPQRLGEAADQRAGRDQLLVDLGVVVGIRDLAASARPAAAPTSNDSSYSRSANAAERGRPTRTSAGRGRRTARRAPRPPRPRRAPRRDSSTRGRSAPGRVRRCPACASSSARWIQPSTSACSGRRGHMPERIAVWKARLARMSACSSGSSVSFSARFIASQKRSPSNLSAWRGRSRARAPERSCGSQSSSARWRSATPSSRS